ncbi:MAG: hypothetical protein RIR10_188 [Planctomycetota bacterium]
MSSLTVISGPMFAGKTTELQRRVVAARALGQHVLVVKPARDTRYAADAIVTHTGERVAAKSVRDATDLLRLVEAEPATPSLVAIDEIHFFASEVVAPIENLLDRGVSVMVAGCDLDHYGEIFAPFDALIPRANEVVHMRGTCARCSAPSTHSERLIAATDRIVVGGTGEFVATCAACFRPSQRSAQR